MKEYGRPIGPAPAAQRSPGARLTDSDLSLSFAGKNVVAREEDSHAGAYEPEAPASERRSGKSRRDDLIELGASAPRSYGATRPPPRPPPQGPALQGLAAGCSEQIKRMASRPRDSGLTPRALRSRPFGPEDRRPGQPRSDIDGMGEVASKVVTIHRRDPPKGSLAFYSDAARHRIARSVRAQAENIDSDQILAELLRAVPIP